MDSRKGYQELKAICVEHGCRCTPQRLAVYSFLKGNRTHPSVNTIWAAVRKKIPSITRESVFRILLEFLEYGVVGRLDKISEARFDGQAHDHGHLICERCGSISDFELPEDFIDFGRFSKFFVRHTEVRISGLCAKCAKAKE